MSHGKFFGPIEILCGLYFILGHFEILSNWMIIGQKAGVIFSFIIIASIILNFLLGLASRVNKTMEIFVLIFFISFPLAYLINEFFVDIITGSQIDGVFLLIMGGASILNGILRFF